MKKYCHDQCPTHVYFNTPWLSITFEYYRNTNFSQRNCVKYDLLPCSFAQNTIVHGFQNTVLDSLRHCLQMPKKNYGNRYFLMFSLCFY